MDKKYIDLFKELAKSTTMSAEKVMDYDLKKQDKEGYVTAQTMRDNYSELNNRIEEEGEDYILNKSDSAKLAVATLITISQFKDQIKLLQNAINGYENDILPKLQALVDLEDDFEISKIANEKFVIKDDN